MSNQNPAFKPGQRVRIHRPNKEGHGAVGHYYGPSQVDDFAWVAFNKEKPDQPIPPNDLHKQAKYPRKLFPLSQLQPYES